jgi:hypothetical protein
MEQPPKNTTEIKELTYDEWKDLSDRLDKIQEALNKLCSGDCPTKRKTKKKSEEKK